MPTEFVKPDEVLAAILGSSEPVRRNQLTQLVLAYVEAHKLRRVGPTMKLRSEESKDAALNPFLKRIIKMAKEIGLGPEVTIVADEKLERLFEGKKSIPIHHLTNFFDLHCESVPDPE